MDADSLKKQRELKNKNYYKNILKDILNNILKQIEIYNNNNIQKIIYNIPFINYNINLDKLETIMLKLKQELIKRKFKVLYIEPTKFIIEW
jgi:hypothetical protein